MVSKVDEFKTVVLAFDDVVVESILNALRYAGDGDFACEIEEEVYGECDGCDCCDEGAPDVTIASLIFDVDSSALESAYEKLNEIADAAERVANAAERLGGALK